jgi:cobalamin-dependent methionine synthase I
MYREVKEVIQKSPLRIIGQDMHIMNPELFQAVERRDSARLAAMARRQMAAGADALDLNLGPVRKNIDLFGWAIETVQDAVPVPLFASSRVLSQQEVMKAHKGTVIINSVTADPATLAPALRQAREYEAEVVVLLVKPGLTPFNVDDRLQIALEVLETAVQVNFPLRRLYLDPLFHLKPDPVTWQLSRGLPDIDAVLETISMLPQLAGEKIRTLVALSSASQFLTAAQRPGLHRQLLPMLLEVGLDAVILNCHDRRLMDIARNPQTAGEEDLHNLPFMQPAEADLDTAAFLW